MRNRNIHVHFLRVCEVGVDLNECVAHPHMSNLVQFIAGLGPRKGTALLKFMRQSKDKGRLENRTQLVQQCRMGPIEVINSSGFIKINTGKYYFTKKNYYFNLHEKRN